MSSLIKTGPDQAWLFRVLHGKACRIRLLIILILISSGTLIHCQETDIRLKYTVCGLNKDLPYNIFEMAMKGLAKIEKISNRNIITIIDYSKSSSTERFYVIDLENNRLLYRTMVAHGRNSGEEFANSFSNVSGSQMSSLGFYVTAETYYGRHGYSLCLDGIEEDINDNARSRAIVIHGADYVSKEFIEKYGRLGRSWGCPALPTGLSKEIIDKITGGTCLFIYGSDPEYFKKSKIIQYVE